MRKHNSSRSALMTSTPALILLAVLGCLSAVFGQGSLGAMLLLFFLFCLAARLWAANAARGVEIQISSPVGGLFPDSTVDFTLTIQNRKLLPVPWMELFCPLSRSLCLMPEDHRVPDDWEKGELEEVGASMEQVGVKRLPGLLWHEEMSIPMRWQAVRRGIYTLRSWNLRTGDGFGIVRVDCPIPDEASREFAVYPRRISVRPELFLRNRWNAETGSSGTMEDVSLLRSSRPYQAGDPMRHINWRMAARGQGMTVNLYETFQPRSMHFLLDGESFAEHPEELEETLSILASEIVLLKEHQASIGLSVCRNRSGAAKNCFRAETVDIMLRMLSAYELLPEQIDKESRQRIFQPTEFALSDLLENALDVGRFYYLTYDCSHLNDSKVLRQIAPSQLSILTWEKNTPFGDYETLWLEELKEGKK